MKFQEARVEEEKGFQPQDLKWIDIQKLVLQSEPEYEFTNIPKQGWRRRVHDFVTSTVFDLTIILIIVLNSISLAIQYETMTVQYSNTLNYIGYFFTSVYILEAALKIISFGNSYFFQNWNKFDFFVVCASIFDIVLNNV